MSPAGRNGLAASSVRHHHPPGTLAAPLAALLWLGVILPYARSDATPPPFPVCTDFHCDRTVTTVLGDGQWQQVRTLFSMPAATPAQERTFIRGAVALLEELTGQSTGNWRDRSRNYLLDGHRNQLDCIAESRNTDTFLRLLEHAGLLRWYSVDERVMRRRWLVSEHWTAVIREHDSGSEFAVDSWHRDNGEPPCIQPLAEWRTGHYLAACAGDT